MDLGPDPPLCHSWIDVFLILIKKNSKIWIQETSQLRIRIRNTGIRLLTVVICDRGPLFDLFAVSGRIWTLSSVLFYTVYGEYVGEKHFVIFVVLCVLR